MQTSREKTPHKPRRDTSEEVSPTDTLLSDLSPPESQRDEFLLFKPLSIVLVMAVSAD